jgi:alkanesulfonate monooxygenase SsuD/methylene tetrahydromethanopterin reductase-like flavin-dependent oxidoreductase (luciferase family)
MTLLREYVTALQALLGGERVTVDGRYVKLDGVRLDWPPPAGALLIGATGPKTLRLSGELAAGTILTGSTEPAGVREAVGHIAAEDHEVVVFLPAATGPGAEDRLRAQQRAYDSPNLGVFGDAGEVAAAIRRWTDAGAGSVILQPTEDEPDLEGFIRFVAQELRPLVG